MRVYTYADTASSHEHGGSYEYLAITKMGSYGESDFPPLFRSQEEARAWRNEQPSYYPSKLVELELQD